VAHLWNFYNMSSKLHYLHYALHMYTGLNILYIYALMLLLTSLQLYVICSRYLQRDVSWIVNYNYLIWKCYIYIIMKVPSSFNHKPYYPISRSTIVISFYHMIWSITTGIMWCLSHKQRVFITFQQRIATFFSLHMPFIEPIN
jgi:hypothetical protein